MSVRKSPPPPGPGTALTKRARVDDEDTDGSNMVMTVASSGEGQRKNALVRSIKRTSGLEAPIVSLSGAHAVSPIPLRPVYILTVILAFSLNFSFCGKLALSLAATDPQGEITSCKFDPSGKTLAACSVDRSICKLPRHFGASAHTVALWRTYPPHENYGILPNVHKQAILDLAYSLDSEVIYSVSPIFGRS